MAQNMPDHAKVVIDEERLTYASPPCVILGHVERELIRNRDAVFKQGAPLYLALYAEETTAGEMRQRRKANSRWRPDAKCRDADGFMQQIGVWAMIFGQESRWREDGEWRW